MVEKDISIKKKATSMSEKPTNYGKVCISLLFRPVKMNLILPNTGVQDDVENDKMNFNSCIGNPWSIPNANPFQENKNVALSAVCTVGSGITDVGKGIGKGVTQGVTGVGSGIGKGVSGFGKGIKSLFGRSQRKHD